MRRTLHKQEWITEEFDDEFCELCHADYDLHLVRTLNDNEWGIICKYEHSLDICQIGCTE